jgi:hypothetical protein
MNPFIAIDPGPERSAFMIYDAADPHPIKTPAIIENPHCLTLVQQHRLPLAIEMVACYGMPVGKEVFETVYWIGRFCQAAPPHQHHRIYRKEIVLSLCHSARAKDAHVRQALIDRFGGEETAITGRKCESCKGRGSTRKIPCAACLTTGWTVPRGPLYGLASHLWAALAVAVYAAEHVTFTEAPAMSWRPMSEFGA